MEKIERKRWIDISKGILIILVVIGHSIAGPYYDLDHKIDYVYLFHMPAFFIVSGYLYKGISSPNEINMRIKKRISRLLIPYLAYLLIINIPKQILLYLKGGSTKDILAEIFNTIYGGQRLPSGSEILWFLTCLLFIEIVMMLMDKYIFSKEITITIIFIMFVFAHVQAWYYKSLALPLAIDIGLIAIAYYAFGYYCKEIIINRYTFLFSAMLSISFVLLRKYGFEQYGFEMWGHHYTSLYLDFIIPIVFSLCVFNISNYISKFNYVKWLDELGKYSLPIMCMHLIINNIITEIMGQYGKVIFITIGVVIPYIVARYILKKSKILNRLFIR